MIPKSAFFKKFPGSTRSNYARCLNELKKGMIVLLASTFIGTQIN